MGELKDLRHKVAIVGASETNEIGKLPNSSMLRRTW